MSLVFSLGLVFQRPAFAPAPIAPAGPSGFTLTTLTRGDEGPALDFVKNLRLSLDGGTTWCRTGAGDAAALTVAVGAAGNTLEISGFASTAQADAVLAHYEMRPSSPNLELNGSEALFMRNTSLPLPALALLPGGLPIIPTLPNFPVGVT